MKKKVSIDRDIFKVTGLGVKGFHDSTKGTYLLRKFLLANKVPSRDFLTNY